MPPSCSADSDLFEIKEVKTAQETLEIVNNNNKDIKFITLEAKNKNLNLTEKILQEIIEDMAKTKESMNITGARLKEMELRFVENNLRLKKDISIIGGGLGGLVTILLTISIIIVCCCLCKMAKTMTTLKG